MQTALIIPVHNQKQHWKRMLLSIERLTELPFCVYVMLDRPSRSDYDFVRLSCESNGLRNTYKVFNVQDIPPYIGRPNNLPDQSLFLTGHRRNLGIEYAINDGCDCFVFIDGDCVPQYDLIKSHTRAASSNTAVLSVGRRRDVQHNWNDQREISDNLKGYRLFTSGDEYIVDDWYLLTTSAIVWSCNMSLNLRAINRLKKFNKKYYGREDVFHMDFCGTWGGEDGFIGIESNKCGITIKMLGDSASGIKHIHHERPMSKYGGESFSEYLIAHIDLLELKMQNSPLTDEFFID